MGTLGGGLGVQEVSAENISAARARVADSQALIRFLWDSNPS